MSANQTGVCAILPKNWSEEPVASNDECVMFYILYDMIELTMRCIKIDTRNGHEGCARDGDIRDCRRWHATMFGRDEEIRRERVLLHWAPLKNDLIYSKMEPTMTTP